jgi:hypothetical protein
MRVRELHPAASTPAVLARRWRLAAAACGRAVWPPLAEMEEARRAVEVAEAAAEGDAGEAARKARVEVPSRWRAAIDVLAAGLRDILGDPLVHRPVAQGPPWLPNGMLVKTEI